MSLELALFTTILLVEPGRPAGAHDIYSSLVDAIGKSCCNEHECRPAPYRLTTAGVQMYVDRGWTDVPEKTIQYRSLPGDTGETAGGHWCRATHEESGHLVFHVTRCAVLPPNSASVAYGRPE